MRAMLLLAASAVCSLTSYGAQIVLGQNAIINPGAELGVGSTSGNDVEPVPGWTTTGPFTVVVYGAPAAPLPANFPLFGNNFFSGGLGPDPDTSPNFVSRATQTIDVSNLAAAIDANSIAFTLSGYFGGYLTQPDNATLKATFFDASDTKISNFKVGGITAADRNQQTVLVYDQGTAFIPVGTRSVLITLTMDRQQYTYDDGYADNLSFVASTVPEPTTWTMLAVGCVLVGLRKMPARRRKVSQTNSSLG